ncbi:MAG: RNA 2',3'-cyclic phosphodiesterase [Candidatus Hodarchaeota archaeon]
MPELRAFVAVEVDDPDVLRNIQKKQRELASSRARLKLVEPENLHFTLHFLGNVDSDRIALLEEILQGIRGEPFDVELVGLGSFRPQRPRVVWIGCGIGADHLVQHQKFLGNQLRRNGFSVESRRYSPHLTIARVKSGENREQLMKVVQDHANYDFGKFQVTHIKLKKSTLTPRGPIYEDLAVKELNV